MENDLIFGTETSDMLTGNDAGDGVQIAAATSNGEPYPDAVAVPLDAAQVVIPQGENVVRVPVQPGEVVELPFPADSQFLAREDNGNLAIKVGDITVILQGYVDAAGQTPPVIEASNGQPLDIATILASTDPNIDIQTAAGPAAGPQGQGADNTGGILTQFGEAGGLGGFEGAGAQDGTDGLGGGTVDQTGTLFRQFGLLEVNAVPIVADDAFNTDEDKALIIPAPGVLGNDSDADGDPLTSVVVTGPAHGTLTLNPDGSFTYTPAKDYNGPDSFTYQADDGKGGIGTATVNLTVNPVNDDPVANDDTYLAMQDTKLVVTAADGFLKNDTDVDGDTVFATLISQSPAHGALSALSDGSFQYTPAAGYFGPDSFKYQISDGQGGTSEATVNIYVDAPPVWLGGAFKETITEEAVNDTVDLNWKITDADDTKFTIAVDPTTLPPGAVYDAALGQFKFTTQGNYDYLAAGQSESFTIKFTITDEHGGSTEQDFTLVVKGVADASPHGVDDTLLTNVGAGVEVLLPDWVYLANDKDASTGDVVALAVPITENLSGATTFGGVGLTDDDTNGGKEGFTLNDGSTFLVTMKNQAGGDLIGTTAHEIIVSGSAAGAGDKIDGKGGQDIIFGGGGDDTVIFHNGDIVNGQGDSITKSNGFATAATRGDVLVVDHDVNFVNTHLTTVNGGSSGGIETISTAAADGGAGKQTVVLGASEVNTLSDHTITGVFSEERAIKIDGDAVDQLYLSISKDPAAGSGWVDTGVDVNGYHVFAHETTAGNSATADAYVMVQAANVANVHLNQDPA